jgi:hypothetical protein
MSVPMQALFNYFKAVIHPGQAVLLFALRTIAAGLLTLYLAFLFDLDQPKWSIMAVVIVSQPLAGMALARSFGQVIGDLSSGTAAIHYHPGAVAGAVHGRRYFAALYQFASVCAQRLHRCSRRVISDSRSGRHVSIGGDPCY